MLGKRDKTEKHAENFETKNGKKQNIVQMVKQGLSYLLVVLIFMSSCISIYLVIKVHKLESQLTRVYGTEQAAGFTEEQAALSDITTETTEQSRKLDRAAEVDVESLENQVVLDAMQSNTNVWDSDAGMRKVYLTFDDGPSSNTDQILDILDEYGVKATFFVVGKEGYEKEYQRIVKEGHTLGMHSYSHKYRDIYQSEEAYAADLNKLQSFLYEVTGQTSQIVRFPGGSSNTVSSIDMQDLIAYLQDRDLAYYDWNVSCGDAGGGDVSAEQITNNVLDNIWSLKTSIVLMHDAADKSTTVEALPTIIEKILESENTVLLPISEGTVPIQHVQAECQ